MTRLFIIFIFLSLSLSAQQSTWQSYIHIYAFNAGADTGETIWLSNYYSVVKYEKGSNKPEILFARELGISNYISDMLGGRDGQVFFLGNQKGKVVEYKDGVLTDWPIDPLFIDNAGVSFLGETNDGALLIMANNGKVIHFDKEDGATFLQNIPTELNGQIRDGAVDTDGNILLWGSRQMILLSPQGELVQSLAVGNEYIYDVQMDDDGHIWMTTSVNVRYWSSLTEEWATLSNEDLEGFYPSRFYMLSGDRVLMLSNVNYVLEITHNGTSFEWEATTDESLFNNDFPTYDAFLDNDDKLWYMNARTNQLMYWEEGESPVAITEQPWLSTSGINAITQDRQGKIWIGGYDNISYLQGGDWHTQTIANPLATFITNGVNDIEFTEDNRPIIAAGSIGFFGALPSFVFEWNGQTWDTLHQAIIGQSLFPVTDLELDNKGNLWVLRDIDNFLSVRTYGEWVRFKPSDMPMPSNVFTFIKEGPEGKMWIGTDKGIATYDGYRFSGIDSTTLSLGTARPEDVLFDDKGQVWVTTSHDGIRKWNGTEWEILRPSLDLSLNFSMKEIIQGVGDDIWVTLEGNGVLYFDGQEWSHLTYENSGLLDSYVMSIMKDERDRIWFGCSAGLSVLHPNENIIIPFELSPDDELVVYPNPGCCLYRAEWLLDQAANTDMQLVNTAGQVLRKWHFEAQVAGTHQLDIQQDDLLPGIYFIQLLIDQKNVKTTPFIVVD